MQAAGVTDLNMEQAWLRTFWWDVLGQIARGELLMRGRQLGDLTVRDITPDLLDDAEPDLTANRITCVGVTFGALRILRQPLLTDATSTPLQLTAGPRPSPSISGRLDYRATDGVLIREMARLIFDGTAKGAEDAAKIVAKRAVGSAKESSKVARLLKRWRDRSG